jgi:S-adenosylmethionine/arginine decarboxylase-like enzyme
MAQYWGFHLILDCAGCDEYAIRDYNVIYNFTKQLVNDIDMVAYGEPMIVNFGSGDKAGYTLVQLIETSNICAHFVNENNTMYLDVFSCKEFDDQIVIDLVLQYFYAKTVKQTFLKRQA